MGYHALVVSLCIYLHSTYARCPGFAVRPDVTPPPFQGRPIIRDNIVYHLVTANYRLVPDRCTKPCEPEVTKFDFGGLVKDNKALIKRDSPHIIKGNINIAPSGCLYIEPGTELRFDPGYGIIVNGTLIARGSNETDNQNQPQWIKFTKNSPSLPTKWPTDARLVDGNYTRDGRFELFHRGTWRGICTNYQNYSKIDANVTCRHLGFLKGNFTYHSYSRNTSDYIVYESPKCVGHENSLFDCPGAKNIIVGKHVCDGQEVIGFECTGLRHDLAADYWRGIEFINSTSAVRYYGNIIRNASESMIEYAVIEYAGNDNMLDAKIGIRHPFASLSASPYPPVLNNVIIRHGAYDGVNMTDIHGMVHIDNSTITGNRGHGARIETASGLVHFNNTAFTHNWGDGVKVYMANYTFHNYETKFPHDESFSMTPMLASPSYPMWVSQDAKVFPTSSQPFIISRQLEKVYTARRYQHITLHVLLLERDPGVSGSLEVRDRDANGKLLVTIPINNGSYPESVTSRGNKLWVRFSWRPVYRCPVYASCLRFLFQLTVTNYSEFQMIDGDASHNNGYGVNVQDMRNLVFFNRSTVTDNKYGAGIRVYQGAGKVIVNNTLVARNELSGVNISYAGGYMLVNNSRVVDNHGYGVITTHMLVNKTRFELRHEIEVVRSTFKLNRLAALRVGNYCRDATFIPDNSRMFVVINESSFVDNYEEAIEYLSCNVSTHVAKDMRELNMRKNRFVGNRRHAVLLSPFLNTKGLMDNNTFIGHTFGVIRIDNRYDLLVSRWYTNFHVEYQIIHNDFIDNSGLYVLSVRLTQGSPLQSVKIMYNILINNPVKESFKWINPRSRAAAVVVLSSSNAIFQRNYIRNTRSVREFATQLIDPAAEISAVKNWWGTDDQAAIFNNIFDQNDRFNLARVRYYPSLINGELYDNKFNDLKGEYRAPFVRGDKIGGVIREVDRFTPDRNVKTYYVDKDIQVENEAVLRFLYGTTLKFAPSIGVMIHGVIDIQGREGSEIRLTLDDESWLPVENRTASVSLEDGANAFEGRLEVVVDGERGTVCRAGWTEENAALVCQQLGLAYHPRYSQPTLRRPTQNQSMPVLLSDVNCNDLDTDLTRCAAVRDHSCTHADDVFMRCQPLTWAGMVLSARSKHSSRTNQITRINNVVIEKAGLLDASSMSYTAGLRIDYNSYVISRLTVKDCAHDGILINFNNPFQESRLERCVVSNNQGNGILTRSSFLEIFYVHARDNDVAGLMFDPFFTEYDSLTIRNFISADLLTEITDRSAKSVRIGDAKMAFLVAGSGKKEDSAEYLFEIIVGSRSYIALEVLDYNPVFAVENVSIHDGPKNILNSAHRVWEIEKDLVDFPIFSSTNVLTIKYTVRGIQSGRFTFIAHSRTVGDSLDEAKLYLRNCTFDRNHQGIVTRHYNNPSNRRNELYFRHKNEVFEFQQVNILRSRAEAIHVPSVTKYHDDYVPTFEEMTQPQKLAQITYRVTLSKLEDNGRSLFAEHNHVDFANNIWKWDIRKCIFARNAAGGIEIELPRINEDIEKSARNRNHSVTVVDTVLSGNKDFAFTVAGYYAAVSIRKNQFRGNKCLFGLMSVRGMEKALNIEGNEFTRNEAMYVVDLDLSSHSEFSSAVTGQFYRNSLRGNYPPGTSAGGKADRPAAYALALRGIEKISANHNVFENSYAFELIAGLTSLHLRYEIDVARNWWGSRDQYSIQDKIVDFDDWNKYAIANYVPFLTQADTRLSASVSQEPRLAVPLQYPYIGGRIMKDTTLPARGTPYIVKSDLTVMPGVILRLEPGTVLEFYPNIGILVLGILEAEGYFYERITFRPATKIAHAIPTRQRRAVKNNEKIRLKTPAKFSTDEGFLELYNSSTRAHSLMCDEQFNEKTAEVVCRQLGKETVNVHVRYTHLYDHYVHGRPMFFRKEFWYYSYYCRGDENTLDQCSKRINYNLVKCVENANYTYVVCGERNIDPKYQYWGNVRFAPDGFEETQQSLHYQKERKFSKLENVDIYGAGFLHGEKVGAIQATYNLPVTTYLNITGCASNGIDYIAPRTDFNTSHLNVSNNLGYALNVLVLNSESELKSNLYQPLRESTIPYDILGMVPICKMEKSIDFSQRIIVYFKYSHRAADCVKTISSRNRIALRLLQINLFHETFSRNVLEIFDGREHHEITALSYRNKFMRTYESYAHTITIHMHASPAQASYGFIAEVVTLPIPRSTYPDDRFKHVITNNVFFGNGHGALQYQSVGEVSPSVYIERCWIKNNGIAVLNLTSLPTVILRMQGTRILVFTNSFVAHNRGAMEMNLRKLHSITVTANVTNNVFAFNTHGETMNITGHYAQEVLVYENDVRNNTAGDWRSVVNMEGVSVNFTYNILRHNLGHHVLSAYNRDDVNNAVQYYTKNAYIANNCTAEYRATVFAARHNTLFHENYFDNPASSFELMSGRRSMASLRRGLINATQNWWGKDSIPYIKGVIRDKDDDPRLLPVVFKPEKTSPTFFQEERCKPGWRHQKGRCYRYIGAALPFQEAKAFCKEIGGFLADSIKVEKFLHYLVFLVQSNPQRNYRIWVMGKVRADRCSSFNNEFVIEQEDCKRLMLPFICDSDPISNEEPSESITLALGLGIAGGLLILLISVIVLILVCIKSKKRKQERIERQDTIRGSIRSARSRSLITGLSDKSKNGSVESYLADPRNIHLGGITHAETSTDPMEKDDSYHGRDFSPDESMGSPWENNLLRQGRGRQFENNGYKSNDDSKRDESYDDDEDEDYDSDDKGEDYVATDDESDNETRSELGTDKHAGGPVPRYKAQGDSPPPGYTDSPRPNPLPRHFPQASRPRNQYGAENEIASLTMSPSREQVLYSNSSMDDRSIDLTSEVSRSRQSLDRSPQVVATPRHQLPVNSTFQSKPSPPPPRPNFSNPSYLPNNDAPLHRSNPNLLQNPSLSYYRPPTYLSEPDLLSYAPSSAYASLTDLTDPPPYEEGDRSPLYPTDEPDRRHPYYESPPASMTQQPSLKPSPTKSVSSPGPRLPARPPNIRRPNYPQYRQPTMETEI